MITKIAVEFGTDDDLLTLRWVIDNNSLANRWLKIVSESIKSGIREHDLLYNFPKQLWNKSVICSRLTDAMTKIEKYYPDIFETWPSPDMDREVSNILHTRFETLRGSIDEPSNFYINAPNDIKLEIDRYNMLIHRWESFIDQSEPRFIGQFNRVNRTPLQDDDYSKFNLDIEWGQLHLKYSQIGKPLLDVFHDQDDVVGDDAIRPMDRYSSTFEVRFTEVSVEEARIKQASFDRWFESKSNYLNALGFYRNDPKLAIGFIRIGHFIPNGMNRDDIIYKIGCLDRINKIWIEND
jgi:hypothetical protein